MTENRASNAKNKIKIKINLQIEEGHKRLREEGADGIRCESLKRHSAAVGDRGHCYRKLLPFSRRGKQRDTAASHRTLMEVEKFIMMVFDLMHASRERRVTKPVTINSVGR